MPVGQHWTSLGLGPRLRTAKTRKSNMKVRDLINALGDRPPEEEVVVAKVADLDLSAVAGVGSFLPNDRTPTQTVIYFQDAP